MPLLQRVIEPVHVCRSTLPLDDHGSLAVDVPNELECVTNGTLANIIRQFSSLSKHAEDIFSSLCHASTQLFNRANVLQGRIERLAVKVTQLDSNVEEVSLQDIHMRKAFKSGIVYDQQVVSRASIPMDMRQIYKHCDRPPPLDKLNPYREDGKDGLKFYTDPDYFFDLWKQEMLKDTERLAHDKGKKLAQLKDSTEQHQLNRQERKRHKKVRQPHNTREKYRLMATKDEFLDKTANYPGSPYSGRPNSNSQSETDGATSPGGHPVRPSSLELQSAYGSGQESGYLSSPTHHYPPPPPAYMEHAPHSPQHHQGYPPPAYSVGSPGMGDSGSGTPTRNLNRTATMRPSQPPPAPPVASSSSSNTSTPNASASGTPSSGAGRYYRVAGHLRDNLPPPPPPPEAINGGTTVYGSETTTTTVVITTKARGQNGSQPVQPPVVPGSVHNTPTHHMANSNTNSINNNHSISSNSSSSSSHVNNNNSSASNHTKTLDLSNGSKENLDLPPPPPTPEKDSQQQQQNPPEEHLPPSPPPPPPMGALPPPPPPLPTAQQLSNGGLILVNGGLVPMKQQQPAMQQPCEAVSLSSESTSTTSSSLSKGAGSNEDTKGKATPNMGQSDARSDLLAAIREGIKLRRVEDIKQKEVEKAAPLHDVASILARRIAMEFSDSDSASYSEYDSDGWDDETEC